MEHTAKQLSGTDSLFLSMETAAMHGHVGGLVVLDPTGASAFGFERFRRTLAERLPRAGAEFVSRLVEGPLGLSRPYLVPDTSFDLDRHVRRIAVPSPGSMRELADLCGFLFEQKLDRRRPLWEMWFIEGLADGRFAVFMKTHHALMDGMKGADLSTILCDLEPEPKAAPGEPPAAPPSCDGAREAAHDGAAVSPSGGALAFEGLRNLVLLPLRMAGYGVQVLRRGASLVPYLLEHGTDGLPAAAPRMSFNGDIGPGRRFAYTSVPLDEIRAIKDAVGVKLNDVVVAICGSAMRRYAEAGGERPQGSLAVACPVSTRAPGDHAPGNQVSSMIVSCASDVAEPVARLQAVHVNANRAKAVTGRLRATPISSVGEVLPPTLVHLGFRALLEIADRVGLVPANAVVSNVPGPPVPLYIAGARVEGVYPISILTANQGVNFTAVSFIGRLDIGVTVDPELVDDPWRLAACVDDAFAELRDAVVPETLATPPSAEARFSPRRPAERAVLPERSIAAA